MPFIYTAPSSISLILPSALSLTTLPNIMSLPSLIVKLITSHSLRSERAIYSPPFSRIIVFDSSSKSRVREAFPYLSVIFFEDVSTSSIT